MAIRKWGLPRKKPESRRKNNKQKNNRFTAKKPEFIPILGVEKIIAREVGFKKNPQSGVLYFTDGSSLHSFGKGQVIYVTQRGRKLLRSNPGIIGNYLKGTIGKGFLAAGGNSQVYVVSVKDAPRGEPLIAVKEHHKGLSPFTQKAHLDALRKATKRRKGVSVPEIFLAASSTGKTIGYSAMQLIPSNKVSETMENLQNRIDKSEPKSQQRKRYEQMLEQLKQEFAKFEKRMKANPRIRKNLTDFDIGNILTRYNPKTKHFEFIIIDQ